jgi:tRNA A58 N-methylase Trm61
MFLVIFLTQGQVGIQTVTPQKTLHVNGSLQITNKLNIGDASIAGSTGVNGEILRSNDPNAAQSWQNETSFVMPTDVSMIIAVNGVLEAVQEINANG